jgi:FkbH-like protein
LELSVSIKQITPETIDRSVQLINRSNQFNLTTRRYSNAEMLTVLANPAWITRTISLKDRFGDNGLVSVLLAKIDGDALVIDTWLMSCRVLKRGVEHFLLNHLVETARELGLRRLVGTYIPTVKNGIVRDHYQTLGFSPLDREESGRTSWQLVIDAEWRQHPTFIQEISADGPNPR